MYDVSSYSRYSTGSLFFLPVPVTGTMVEHSLSISLP